jgi:hypothetical protein
VEKNVDPLTTWQNAEARARAARVRAYEAGLQGDASVPAESQSRAQLLQEQAHAALEDYLYDMELRALSRARF